MRILSMLAGLVMLATVSTANAAPADPENTLLLQLKDGTVTIQLRPDLAPNHVARIKQLTREGFYDGIKFHRVIEGFMAQTGDPTGTGAGGSKLPDLKAEFNGAKHITGTVSMARAGSPDSANSQFFICFKPASFLDGQYTIFGQVTSGMEFVNKIARGEPPANPDKIISMKILADTLKAPAAGAAPAAVSAPAPAGSAPVSTTSATH